MTDALTNTGNLIADLAIPIAFVVGTVVLFIVVPRLISWFKLIGGDKRPKNRDKNIEYIYTKEGRLAGARFYGRGGKAKY